MSALLKFLAAARSLASQGLKKEEIYGFAQREFGEVNELMKKQIDNIFKPQKPIAPKDPNFDNTVQKLGIDDQGKPFNPKDPLNNMATDTYSFGYKKGKEFQLNVGSMGKGSLKEMIDSGELLGDDLQAALNALKSRKADGGRAGYYGGGMTNMVEPDLSDIGHGGESLNARTRVMSPGSQATTSTGLNYLLGEDNDNTRVPFNKGKLALKVADQGRRGFMKAAGAGAAGIAALKTGLLGFGEKIAPVAKETVEAVSNTAGQVPAYFLNLVKKIKTMGDDASRLATQDRQKVTTYKDYTLTEDIATGKQEIQRMKVLDDDSASYYGQPLTEETYMSYTPGETLPGKGKIKPLKTADEYEEGTALLRSDRGNAGDIVDESATISDDVIKEGTVFEDTLSEFGKADGGRIGYSKGKLVKEGIPALINKVKSLFGDDAITTADKIPTPQKTLDRDMFKAADNRLNDKKMMNADELEDFEMDKKIGDNLEAYDFDGTIGDAKRILQEEKNYMDEMFAEYKSIGGSKRLGGPKDPMKDAIDNASPGYTGDLKYDAQLVADDLAEKMYGVEYDDLTQTQQMDLYDKAYTALAKNQQGFKEMQKLSKPEKTLEGIKNTGTIDISNPDVAEEFTKFIKESDSKGFKDIEQKIQLESFDPKKTKGNAKGGRITYSSGGLAAMLGE